MKNLGARIYGMAAMIMGIAGLIWDDFAVDWVPVPATLPARAVLAYLAGALLLGGGALINWPRRSAWGAAMLTGLFGTGLVLLDLTRLAMHPLEFSYWDSSAEQLACVAGGLVAYARCAEIDPLLSSRLQIIGRAAFGICLFSFGAAHFAYPEFTAPLVPKWLWPGQMFWADFTGAAAIAAGLAILSGLLSLLAARLLTAMYIIFAILVHAPLLLANPASHRHWIENALNLALVGTAWIIADSLAGGARTEHAQTALAAERT